MKLYLGPLWKFGKKPDLEETLGPLWNWKVVRDETGKGRMVMRLRLSKDAVAREAKAGYKAGNELIDKSNEESKEYEDNEEEKPLSEEEYKQKIREAFSEGNEYLRKGDTEKAVEKFDTVLKSYYSLEALNPDAFYKCIQREKKRLEEMADAIVELQSKKRPETKYVIEFYKKRLETFKEHIAYYNKSIYKALSDAWRNKK